MVQDFASKIELSNSSMVLQYGAGAQKKMADFSESALNNVRTKDLGEIGGMLSNVVTQLKSFDVEEEEKGFLGFFKRGSNKLTSMKAKYAKAGNQCGCDLPHAGRPSDAAFKGYCNACKMYELNKVYFKELSMYILAGKKKLAQTRAEQLPILVEKAKQTGLPEDAQAANDLSSLCGRFEKKLHDLELTRMISIQMAPQIRLVRITIRCGSEKIQSHAGEYDPAVEKPDGVGFGRCSFPAGGTGAARSDGYDQ